MNHHQYLGLFFEMGGHLITSLTEKGLALDFKWDDFKSNCIIVFDFH